ncbi:hypothetical protein [Desulfotruncus arcticus]|nr:hypothetical protein [Desulfotruncus arcticus]
MEFHDPAAFYLAIIGPLVSSAGTREFWGGTGLSTEEGYDENEMQYGMR